MKVIFALAGEGNRFRNYFRTIKPLIEIGNKYMFQYAAESFPDKYEKIFVIQEQHSLRHNLDNIIEDIYPESKIVETPPTIGQSETVYRGLNLLDDNENFMIFNCDSCFDDLSFFNKLEELINNYSVDGCIPYFISTDKLDNKWSFLETQNNKIISIKEKQKISDKASIGLYYFKSKLLYEKYYKKAFDNFSLANELYVSNVYEKMLKDNLDIYAIKVNNFECFGTPEELENFKSKYVNLDTNEEVGLR